MRSRIKFRIPEFIIEPIENEPEVVEEAKRVEEQFATLIKQAKQNSEPATSSSKEPSEQVKATLEKDKLEKNQNVFNKELDTSNVFNNYDIAESQKSLAWISNLRGSLAVIFV